MTGFILKRLFYGLLVMATATCIITSIIFLSPVDPTRLTFGQRADDATVAARKAEYGLDQSLGKQLALYLKDLSPIDVLPATPLNKQKYRFHTLIPLGSSHLVLKYPYLRESYQSGRRVTEVLRDALPATALLAIASIIVAAFLGIGLGIWSALRQNTITDHLISVVSVLGYSLPSYVAAMILALALGYWWADITGLNLQGSLYVLDDFGNWKPQWKNLLLPALALGLRPVALITQLTRSAMLDTLSMDFVRTARAKGLSEWAVIARHTLRNAFNPIISAISSWFASLLTGAFFVESVFNFKGLGSVTVTALLHFDIPVVLGCVLVTSAIFIAVNILTDIAYSLADPRVRTV